MRAKRDREAARSPSGVDRVLAILKEVAEHPRGISLASLSELSGAPKPSVHRALLALRRAGFVEKNRTTSRYQLGLELVRLAFTFHQNLDELRELAARFSETIHHGRLDGAEVVYMAKVTPSDRTCR